jgi:hypothetical protein
MPPTFTVAALKINALKALKPQEEDLRNGRSVSRDRAVAGFDLDAGERYAHSNDAGAHARASLGQRLRCDC